MSENENMKTNASRRRTIDGLKADLAHYKQQLDLAIEENGQLKAQIIELQEKLDWYATN
jgi:regulator of replication initiation timing